MEMQHRHRRQPRFLPQKAMVLSTARVEKARATARVGTAPAYSGLYGGDGRRGADPVFHFQPNTHTGREIGERTGRLDSLIEGW